MKIIRNQCISVILIGLFTVSCGSEKSEKSTLGDEKQASCCQKQPSRYGIVTDKQHGGMVFISGGSFLMGGTTQEARPDEYPRHKVEVSGFWIDIHEVTNKQFKEFVDATGYVTIAEQKPDWEEVKKQMPAGTPKPDESLLVAASLVFKSVDQALENLPEPVWWEWMPGANWKHPYGPGSGIEGLEDHPVVHVAWEDAMAYCKWADKRLPTEAEWEYAALGGNQEHVYAWGNEKVDEGEWKTNCWQGIFPSFNSGKDGYYTTAPVQTYSPNSYGLYDMSGNVWEWCSDWYHSKYYEMIADGAENPQGPKTSFDPQEPTVPKKVTRGGSFLCNDSYCSGYRVAARMKTSPDTGLCHTGFRCVAE